ncbi:ATP-binding protein [Burkholderia cepacia]|uniref:ATP-binding protein n=1 Tax=Burkholderia cepacia TaxID=292 RepID=UPI00075AFAA1|nr:ATP-binding protein [Burkholderia cepacia]KVF18379.1 hypothetical protein WJ06_20535 [Burkholderia cepacia]RQT94075.1 ATP-binding protein [Burkholderia cepacia]UIY62648.1 ATP-binding protein [Burkholderia cepacia]
MSTPSPDPSLAHGGGNATAAGVSFQAGVASYFGAVLLGEKPIDRLSDLARAVPFSIRVETEAPVDDILIETTAGGFIFIQAKTSVALALGLASPLGKTVDQFVRQWMACASGSAHRRWDRPLSRDIDRLVLAVGPESSGTVTHDLALALRARRADGSAPLPVRQQQAFERFNDLLGLAWQQISGAQPDATQLAAITALVDVLVFDFNGSDRTLVIESMRDIVQAGEDAAASFAALQECFTRLMSNRLGVDAAGLRNRLSGSLRLDAPPSYRADVVRLQAYSDETRTHLEHFEETSVGGNSIRIERNCTESVLGAATESILLVGDPGAGKSAVISAAAARLRNEGKEVIELAVDRLPVESAEGLQQQLGLANRVLDVLENWPGNEPAFLFIDALDATRGGRSEGVFRWLIAEVLKMPRKRWRVVASIRSFDLRMGQQLAELFAGRPPDGNYADRAFSAVKHIHIPPWENDELEELLQRAGPIADAVRAGGNRLFDLARTPFNTRLLADLLSGGVSPDAFSAVSTQSQLLELYWAHRVRKYGLSAEVCLRQVIEQMVERRSLQVDRVQVASNSAVALENLLHESVLMSVSGERYIAFRHHILFDFAASRVYLDLLHPQNLASVLGGDRALGLMLGPALIFALNELWLNSNATRDEFWRAILVCVGRPDMDPVVRSIAARVACTLPDNFEDVRGLLAPLGGIAEERAQAKTALTHVIGSLAVHAEDADDIALEPWSYFAAELGGVVEQVAWPLRTLLFLLTGRNLTPDQRAQLGSASRALLRHGLSSVEELVTAAIGFVGDTYGSDPAASRQLLRSLFLPARFDAHGDDDIPWLTRKLDAILAVDPEFVLEIYEKTFACGIVDDSETSIGQSKILPLRTNRRQAFQMANWNLKEFFIKFLHASPGLGTKAYVRALHGYVLREHPLRDTQPKHVIDHSGGTCLLQEDWSHIWASNPDDRHADNAIQIAQQFSKWLRDATPEAAIAATQTIILENEMAIAWARLFMVAAERSDVLGAILWPIATSFPFLWASDTRKDVVDFIAATYPQLSLEERTSFESRTLAFDFADASDPGAAREYVLKRLFATIGPDRLQTEEAKVFAIVNDAGHTRDHENRRLASYEVSSYAVDDFWWLREQGVDTAAPENADLLARTTHFKNELSEQNRTRAFPAIGESVARLTGFLSEVDGRSDSHPLVKSYATGAVADGLEVIVSMFESELARDEQLLDALVAMTVTFASHVSPEMTPGTEESFENSPGWGSPAPRVSAAVAAMVLASTGESAMHQLRAVIEQLLKDPHPAVRMAVATRINALWFTDRALMWQLAERVVDEENNGSVLSFFANDVLSRLVHSDSERVEALAIKLSNRPCGEAARQKLRVEIGSLIAILWVSYQRPSAKALIEEWLQHIVESDEELNQAITTLRGGLVLGYGSRNDVDIQIRRRSIELANWVSGITAANLAGFLANPTSGTREQAVATVSAGLLSHLLNQIYFSSGAFRHGESGSGEDGTLTSLESRREFLNEITPILERVTDVGGPGTIYYLIDLLEFLMDADPEAVFDLAARALLGAGQQQGYQFESLGADQVVKLIGRFLADHRVLFDQPLRRQTLVKCLDVFIEVGWPSARRLLYRLPELLQ